MAGIGTSPTGGFFSRFLGQAPGMINALGQQYGGDMAGSARASSALLGARPRMPKGPKVTNGIPRGQMPGQQMPMPQIPQQAEMPATSMGGPINTSPSGVPGFGGGFWNPAAKGPLQFEMNGMPMNMGNGGGGGLFDTYNRFRSNVRF